MPSIIEGYNYDIFISYRQKDNKGDKWVSKFVDALKTELEATFKEDISVYFDENPHDRLQETHNVDKSLEGKLKCLIFIPILSQTYCDPNSYAWQYEFLSFNKLTNEDRFGRDIKLKSGNVASRILPVRIHDLEPEDVKLFEKETGSVLRAIDFIFKTATGVSRPLVSAEEHPNDNLNKTFYRDQINKLAHAIKEIILGMNAEPKVSEETKSQPSDSRVETKKTESNAKPEKVARASRSGLFWGRLITAALVIILALIFVPKFLPTRKNKVTRDSDGRISIAVTDFDNQTNDTSLTWLEKGIPELLRNNLTGSKELLVQNSQTMYELYESMSHIQTASVASSLSREAAIKLNAGTYITGSFQKYGDKILTLVKLVDTKSEELLWTGKIEGNIIRYTHLTDSLAGLLKNFLEIEVLKKNPNPEFEGVNTKSPEALRNYIEGIQLFAKQDNKSAIHYLQQAYRFDTTFTLAAFYSGWALFLSGNLYESNKWLIKAFNGKGNLPYDYQVWMKQWNSDNSDSVLYYNDQLQNSDVNSRFFWYDVGNTYQNLKKFEKAIKAYEKIEKLNSEWAEQWKYKDYYYYFGSAYHNLNKHQEEAKIYESGLNFFPDDMSLTYGEARCALTTNDSTKASLLIYKLKKLGKDKGYSDIDFESVLGQLYKEANHLNESENHYRRALQLDPNNYKKMNDLALFLIITDRNVAKGMSYVNDAMAIKPDNKSLILTKGIGYYKLGKYRESYELLLKYKEPSENYWWNATFDEYFKRVKEALALNK